MINFIRRHLGVKLFLSYILVILVGVGVLWLASTVTVPQVYNHQVALPQAQGQGVGPGMMQGQGPGQGQGMMAQLQLFQASFNQALWLAALAAGIAAVAVSLLLTRGVTAPLRGLSTASGRIAEGHYEERVRTGSVDELGQLGSSFNRMADKLEQVESMRRQLIGDVSHELRTPLTAITGSMEGLLDGVLPATPETYQQIQQEAGRMARLVDDLQELSRVEAGAYTLEMKPVSLSAVTATILKRFSTLSADRNISLRADLPADLPRVMADEARLTQVLTNLVGNALHYTPEGGQAVLSVCQIGDEVRVSVKDTGIGIPAEHLPHLFTRFYRVDKSRSRQAGGGSGIGLTIAKFLVEAQGGHIRAESEGPGKGSTFSFTLKAAR